MVAIATRDKIIKRLEKQVATAEHRQVTEQLSHGQHMALIGEMRGLYVAMNIICEEIKQ